MVLTRDWAVERLNSVTVAPIISAVRTGPVFVAVSLEDGLLEDSVVNGDRLVTVPKSELTELVTMFGGAKLAAVTAAVRFALDLGQPPNV